MGGYWLRSHGSTRTSRQPGTPLPPHPIRRSMTLIGLATRAASASTCADVPVLPIPSTGRPASDRSGGPLLRRHLRRRGRPAHGARTTPLASRGARPGPSRGAGGQTRLRARARPRRTTPQPDPSPSTSPSGGCPPSASRSGPRLGTATGAIYRPPRAAPSRSGAAAAPAPRSPRTALRQPPYQRARPTSRWPRQQDRPRDPHGAPSRPRRRRPPWDAPH